MSPEEKKAYEKMSKTELIKIIDSLNCDVEKAVSVVAELIERMKLVTAKHHHKVIGKNIYYSFMECVKKYSDD